MNVTTEQKKRIAAAIQDNRQNYPSDSKHAAALGINTAVYSRLKKGEYDNVMSDANFITIARRLGVSLRNEIAWKAAETPTYKYITQQLTACQQSSLSGLLCDIPNIGKSFTAKVYVRTHKNAVYVDCGQVKTKMRMIRFIAKEFGVNAHGRYADVYDDLVYYLKSIERPIVILDEAGDMAYETFEELKALWNATEHCCGWFMMGANGLKKKIRCGMERETNSYEEMFSRFGGKFGRVTPEDERERAKFMDVQVAMIAKINAPAGTDVQTLVGKSKGSLRRVYTEIEKMVMQG